MIYILNSLAFQRRCHFYFLYFTTCENFHFFFEKCPKKGGHINMKHTPKFDKIISDGTLCSKLNLFFYFLIFIIFGWELSEGGRKEWVKKVLFWDFFLKSKTHPGTKRVVRMMYFILYNVIPFHFSLSACFNYCCRESYFFLFKVLGEKVLAGKK